MRMRSIGSSINDHGALLAGVVLDEVLPPFPNSRVGIGRRRRDPDQPAVLGVSVERSPVRDVRDPAHEGVSPATETIIAVQRNRDERFVGRRTPGK
jgi:hypothetical protein